MYKLKVKKGSKLVTAKLRSGNDIVNATIKVGSAKSMIARGEEIPSPIEGYPIGVLYDNYEWYFPGTEVKEKETDSNE